MVPVNVNLAEPLCRSRRCQPLRLCQIQASPARVARIVRPDWFWTAPGTWPAAQPCAVSSGAAEGPAVAPGTTATAGARASAAGTANIVVRFISLTPSDFVGEPDKPTVRRRCKRLARHL